METKVKFDGYDCNVEFSTYTSNEAAGIMLVDNEDSLVTVASVNVENSAKIAEDEVAIKDYSENVGIEEVLISAGVIENEFEYTVPSGFVNIPVYKLSNEAYKEVDKFRDKIER